jgi:hypothetical protein
MADDPSSSCAMCKSYSLEARPWQRLWSQLSGRTDRGPQHLR